jgi:hypothetical protein
MTLHTVTKTDHDGGRLTKVRRDEERIRVSGQVCLDMGTSFQSSPMRCTCTGISPHSSRSPVGVQVRAADEKTMFILMHHTLYVRAK